MFADDIAAAINKPADFGKKGRHGDTSGRPWERNMRTVYSLVYLGNGRPIKALRVSDGMCPLWFAIPRLPPGAFIGTGCRSLIKARSASKGITERMNCLRTD